MSFKRPFVPHKWGRERTQDEVDQDRRLDAIAARLAAAQTRTSRDDWVRAQYRAASRNGLSKEGFEGRYRGADMIIMDAHVSQMFYQMVRKLLHMSPTFGQMLTSISENSGREQDDVLEHLRKMLWTKMQQIDDDPSHTLIYKHVERLHFEFMEQAMQRSSNTSRGPPRPRSGSMFGSRFPRGREDAIQPALWNEILDDDLHNAMVPEFWQALDELDQE